MDGRSRNQLNCFSPPVMVATMASELIMTAYTVWRYKLDLVGRLITSLLVCLAIFQLAEYYVCTGIGSVAGPWSRVGFVAITALPPIGFHLMHVLADKPNRRLVYSAYATMIAYMGLFLFSPGTFTGHECTGNYVIFQFTANITGVYSVYYFGWLAAGIGLGFKWANELKDRGKSKLRKLQTVQGLILGYLIFLVPSALSMAVKPSVRRGIPSVLCGFAVLLALVLTLYILPRAGRPRLAHNLTKA
ncbi:MAG TPA: hypothetical protein VLF79_03105 [Candidatus Saccharimonadales bacterium]|nr:hypothetical protein [Candidatus Saccharimonadales bacterium]